jgi:hypothetical protein
MQSRGEWRIMCCTSDASTKEVSSQLCASRQAAARARLGSQFADRKLGTNVKAFVIFSSQRVLGEVE